MDSLDVLRYSLSAAALLSAFGFIYVAWWLVQTIKSIKGIVDDVEDTTHDVKLIKDSVKMGVGAVLGRLMPEERQGGVKDGKKTKSRS